MTDAERDEVLKKHEPEENSGGFIGCSCGWPSENQYNSGEHFVVHVLGDLTDALHQLGVDRSGPPRTARARRRRPMMGDEGSYPSIKPK